MELHRSTRMAPKVKSRIDMATGKACSLAAENKRALLQHNTRIGGDGDET